MRCKSVDVLFVVFLRHAMQKSHDGAERVESVVGVDDERESKMKGARMIQRLL